MNTTPLLHAVLQGEGMTYRLEQGQELSLGRGEQNHVKIDRACVSRRHATLRWRNGQDVPLLVDHGGANGTLLDGREVHDEVVPLEGRHQIRLGVEGPAFWVEIHYDDGGPLHQGSSAVRLFTDQGEELEGRLDSAAPLPALLRGLESQRRSGTLRLQLQDGDVDLTFCLGQIMAAQGWGTTGMLVLKRCLLATVGDYRFEADFEPSDDPLGVYASELLKQTETRPE